MRTHSNLAILIFLVVLGTLPSRAEKEEWRWRVWGSDDSLSLYIAQTDGGTDFTASPSLRCMKGTARAKVRGEMDDQLRAALADIIIKNESPIVTPLPAAPNEVDILEVHYSEAESSWMYSFDISVSTAAFEALRSTGVLRFRVAGIEVEQARSSGWTASQNFRRDAANGCDRALFPL